MQVFKITLFLLFSTTLAIAKVDPPNYNFSLDQFKKYTPGSAFTPEKKTEVVSTNSQYTIFKVFLSHTSYKFPLLVQVHKGKITDFHASLPSYFLHNVFHQSLINRHGKQNRYLNKEEHSVYVWNNVKGVKYNYLGACTITCFPVYLSATQVVKPANSFKSIIEQLSVD